jgi:hypothetical protein
MRADIELDTARTLSTHPSREIQACLAKMLARVLSL